MHGLQYLIIPSIPLIIDSFAVYKTHITYQHHQHCSSPIFQDQLLAAVDGAVAVHHHHRGWEIEQAGGQHKQPKVKNQMGHLLV